MELLFLNPPLNRPPEERTARAKRALQIWKDRVKKIDLDQDNRWAMWSWVHSDMAAALDVDGIQRFQQHETVMPFVTGGSGEVFLSRLAELHGLEFLDGLLRNHQDTTCGQPLDLVSHRGFYLTVTSMRHLYHLGRIKHFCDLLYREPMPFLEIGGGFGNLARIMREYEFCDRYCIIDHPLMSSIQYFFLTEFLPESEIAIIDEQGNFLTGSERSRIQLASLFGYKDAVAGLGKRYGLVSTQALTEIDEPGQNVYLRTLDPEFSYVYGQFRNVWVGGGKRADFQGFDNDGLVFKLGERFHTLDYKYFGYHFEHIGRRRHAR